MATRRAVASAHRAWLISDAAEPAARRRRARARRAARLALQPRRQRAGAGSTGRPRRSCCRAARRRWRRSWPGATSTTCRSSPRGGGTGLVGGAVPTPGGVVCSLERLRARARAGARRCGGCFVEAGVTTRHVQRLARENGLMFAPDPGAAEQSQIGGNVATNAGGPHALKYGVTGVVGQRAWRSCWRPGELADVGGWIAQGRRRLRPQGPADRLGGDARRDHRRAAAAAAGARGGARAGGVPARSRADGCEAILRVLGAGLRPSVLDFLDGGRRWRSGRRRLSRRALPGVGRVRADRRARRERREVAAQRREAVARCSAGWRSACTSREDEQALWRWRDGDQPRRDGRARREGERGRGRSRSSGSARGARRLRRDRRAPRPALVRLGARRRGQRARDRARRPARESELDAAEAVDARSCTSWSRAAAARSPASTASGCSSAAGSRAQWSPQAVELHERSSRRSTRRGC